MSERQCRHCGVSIRPPKRVWCSLACQADFATAERLAAQQREREQEHAREYASHHRYLRALSKVGVTIERRSEGGVRLSVAKTIVIPSAGVWRFTKALIDEERGWYASDPFRLVQEGEENTA